MGRRHHQGGEHRRWRSAPGC